MKNSYWKPENLILVRSDTGNGGWSLHAPWATNQQIAEGEEPPLLSGTAEMDAGEWNAPSNHDYKFAFNILSARDKCRLKKS